MPENKNFAWPVTTFGKYDLDAFCEFLEKKKGYLENKKIVVFGSGIRGTQFSLMLKKNGYQDICFTDNNEKKVGGWINEYPIIPVSSLLEMKDEIVVLISAQGNESIRLQLREMGFLEDVEFFSIENHLYEKYEEAFLEKGHSEIHRRYR